MNQWDTAGAERYRNITASYLPRAAGIMIVYDITNSDSFNNLRNWFNQLEEYITQLLNFKLGMLPNMCTKSLSEISVMMRRTEKSPMKCGRQYQKFRGYTINESNM